MIRHRLGAGRSGEQQGLGMKDPVDFLLVGGGLASATAADTLRDDGAQGSIAIICCENQPPYHRPPLSKEFLTEPTDLEKILVRAPSHYAERGIELWLNTRVVAIDPATKTLRTDRAETIAFRQLLIATGADPCRLRVPGGDLAGIFYLRTFDHAEAVRSATKKAKRAVVVGASFLGMEVAASLTKKGLAVTVVEKGRYAYSSFDAPDISNYFVDGFERAGVTFVFNDEVAAFRGDATIAAVVTGAQRVFPCDIVVVAVGVSPNICCRQWHCR
jgi:NTE family protein